MEINKQREIQLNQTEKLFKLSALLSVDSFFYGLFDRQRILTKSVHIDIFENPKIQDIPLHQDEACIGILNDSFTLVSHSDHLLGSDPLTDIDDPSKELFCDELPNIDARLYYKLHPEQSRFLKDNFTNFQQTHLISALIRNVEHEKTGSFIHVTKIETSIIVVVFDNSKVLMANTFQPSDDISILYYLQLICHQYGLQKEMLAIELSGMFTNPDRSTSFLDLYFDRVSYSSLDLNPNSSSVYSSLLLSILKCAS